MCLLIDLTCLFSWFCNSANYFPSQFVTHVHTLLIKQVFLPKFKTYFGGSKNRCLCPFCPFRLHIFQATYLFGPFKKTLCFHIDRKKIFLPQGFCPCLARLGSCAQTNCGLSFGSRVFITFSWFYYLHRYNYGGWNNSFWDTFEYFVRSF